MASSTDIKKVLYTCRLNAELTIFILFLSQLTLYKKTPTRPITPNYMSFYKIEYKLPFKYHPLQRDKKPIVLLNELTQKLTALYQSFIYLTSYVLNSVLRVS